MTLSPIAAPPSPKVLDTLPASYRSDPLLRAFAAGLDSLLGPAFAELDALPARFELASQTPPPTAFLHWLALAVGAATETDWEDAKVRRAVAETAWLAARRGTAQGLKREAEQVYGWKATVTDPGKAEWSDTEPGKSTSRVVTVKLALNGGGDVDAEQARRLLARHLPAHVHRKLTGVKQKPAPDWRTPEPTLPVPMLHGTPEDRRAALELAARKAVQVGLAQWTATDDPGSALIAACAAVAAPLRDRLPLVAERHRVMALHRLGARPCPAVAAHVDVTFRLSASPVQPVAIPAGTQVATAAAGTAPGVAFSTVEPALITPCTLIAWGIARPSLACAHGVVSGEISPGCAHTRLAPGESLLILAHGLAPDALVRVDVTADPAPRPPAPGVWEAWQGAGWAPCHASHTPDTTEDLTRSGSLVLHAPPTSASAQVRLTDLGGGPGWDQDGVWLFRYRPALGRKRSLGQAPARDLRLRSLALAPPTTATVPAIQGELVDGEVLGVSTGLPGQRFRFAHQPLPEGWPVLVEVSADGRTQYWDLVDSFAHSAPLSRHAMLNAADRELLFGPLVTGPGPGGGRQYGAVPPAGARIRIRRYATGGGATGNVPALAITALRKPIPHVAAVTNEKAATGGADPQSPATAFARAPLALPGRERAVTRDEYERLATDCGTGVRQAHCLPHNGLALLDPIREEVLPWRPARTRIAFTRTVSDQSTDMPAPVVLNKGAVVAGTAGLLSNVHLETLNALRLGSELMPTTPVAPVVIPSSGGDGGAWPVPGEVWDRFLVALPWRAADASPEEQVLKVVFGPEVRRSIADARMRIEQELAWCKDTLARLGQRGKMLTAERTYYRKKWEELKGDRHEKELQELRIRIERCEAEIRQKAIWAATLRERIAYMRYWNWLGWFTQEIKKAEAELKRVEGDIGRAQEKIQKCVKRIDAINMERINHEGEILRLLQAIRNCDDQLRAVQREQADIAARQDRLEARLEVLQGDPFEAKWEVWKGAWEPVDVKRTAWTQWHVLQSASSSAFPTADERPPEAGRPLPGGTWLRCTIVKRGEVQFSLLSVEALRTRGTAEVDQLQRVAGFDKKVEQDGPGHVARIGTGVCGPLPVVTHKRTQLRVVEDLLSSGSADPDVVLDRQRGELRFGVVLTEADGRTVHCGRVPTTGDMVTVTGLVTTLGAKVNDEMVTDAKLEPGNDDVKTVSVLHPLRGGVTADVRLRDRDVPEVGLLIVPGGIENADGRVPYERLSPSPELVRRIRDRVARRRPVGVRVDVSPTGYQWVRVETEIVADRHLQQAAREELRRTAVESLNRLFSPVRGPDGSGWPLGRPVLRGDAFHRLTSLPGVALVHDVRLYAVDPDTHQKLGEAVPRIATAPHATVLSHGHRVTIVGDDRMGAEYEPLPEPVEAP
ncbi:putative baseplate assembly protein [Streptomyces chrestomyceticus]|uniref:putative baseplate assembly protein n=1 Tax=Streptomyces chrestomyceticus TaxID=68185 RepID=UPI0019D2B2D1|nr:putative baseplate assembly protein [Streptomyces chrestomyceticus]